jgi:hypothetical protein
MFAFGTKDNDMTYEVIFLKKTSFLHAIVTGINSKENILNYMKEIKNECQALNIHRVLIEEKLEGPRLETLDIYQIAKYGSIDNNGVIIQIAYVDINARGDLMKFAETAATNRGLPIRVFNSISEAVKWLNKSK